MAGNRHCWSAAMRAPRSLPSLLSTTVEYGVLNRGRGTEKKKKMNAMRKNKMKKRIRFLLKKTVLWDVLLFIKYFIV
jgi:hypothetical protein